MVFEDEFAVVTASCLLLARGQLLATITGVGTTVSESEMPLSDEVNTRDGVAPSVNSLQNLRPKNEFR